MTYDLSALNSTNVENWLDIVTAVNTVSTVDGNPIFSTLLLFSIWIFFYVGFKKEDKVEDFVTSFFLTSIFGMILLFVGVAPFGVAMMPVFGLLISLLVLFFTS